MRNSGGVGPWRKVVFIEEKEGPNGGRYWRLKLDECGHHVHRPIPKPRFEKYMAPLVAMRDRHGKFKRPRTTPQTAPHRVRCIWCRMKQLGEKVDPPRPCRVCKSEGPCRAKCPDAPWNQKEKRP